MFEDMEWNTASPDELEQGLAHFAGLRAAVDAELCRLIQAADRAQMWMSDGARSLTEWVSLRLRVSFSRARRLVTTARRLEELPYLTECFSRGELSLDQVEVISGMATGETEQALVTESFGLSNQELKFRARSKKPPAEEEETAVWERRRVVRQWNLDESEFRFWGNLPGDQGQILDTAIEDGIDRIPVNPETDRFDSVETRAADALVQMAATTGDESSPPQVTIHADLGALTTQLPSVTELGSGALIPNETARRLCCDAVVETAVHDPDQSVVGIGRNSRTVPGWLRRQVEHRDHNLCRFPGCGARRWLHAHHIQHWVDGGRTDLDNLILLCGFHHRFLHEHGWTITKLDEEFVFQRSDLTIYPRPRPTLDTRLKRLVESGRSI